MIPDRYTIGDCAALVVITSSGVHLRPGRITGVQPAPVRTKAWNPPTVPDRALWTPTDGVEEELPEGAVVLARHELADKIVDILWPGHDRVKFDDLPAPTPDTDDRPVLALGDDAPVAF